MHNPNVTVSGEYFCSVESEDFKKQMAWWILEGILLALYISWWECWCGLGSWWWCLPCCLSLGFMRWTERFGFQGQLGQTSVGAVGPHSAHSLVLFPCTPRSVCSGKGLRWEGCTSVEDFTSRLHVIKGEWKVISAKPEILLMIFSSKNSSLETQWNREFSLVAPTEIVVNLLSEIEEEILSSTALYKGRGWLYHICKSWQTEHWTFLIDIWDVRP